MRDLALTIQAPAWRHQVVDTLISPQRRLNAVLPGHVGTQAHRGKHVEPFNIISRRLTIAGNHHPSGTITTGAVILRQAIEADRQDILRERGDRRMRHAIVQNFVINLIGVDDQSMLAGDGHDFTQEIVRIKRPGRIVRIDDDDGARMRGNLRPDVVEIRQPAIVLVAQIMARRATGQAHGGRPQRIVRRWNQHLVTRIEQSIHGHHDQFGHPVPDVDILQRHALDLFLLRVMHHRLTRRKDPLRIGVARRVGQVADHIELDFLRRIEAKGAKIADIELDDLVPFIFHALGLLKDRSADVITDVGQLVRL